jgi:hypothetical protein
MTKQSMALADSLQHQTCIPKNKTQRSWPADLVIRARHQMHLHSKSRPLSPARLLAYANRVRIGQDHSSSSRFSQSAITRHTSLMTVIDGPSFTA